MGECGAYEYDCLSCSLEAQSDGMEVGIKKIVRIEFGMAGQYRRTFDFDIMGKEYTLEFWLG